MPNKRTKWIRENTIMKTPDSMNVGDDLSVPSSSSTILPRVTGIVSITEPSLVHAGNEYVTRQRGSHFGGLWCWYEWDLQGLDGYPCSWFIVFCESLLFVGKAPLREAPDYVCHSLLSTAAWRLTLDRDLKTLVVICSLLRTVAY